MLKGTMVTPMSASCFLKSCLRVVWAVEGLAVGVVARTGVIAADDEVSAPVVLADQSVPDRFARSAHAHRQRQQRQLYCALRILVETEVGSSGRA